ncbi:MAG: ATP-binding cassette domain-containing protein [Pseudobutyrivibrio sp.]|nr:ATP-binding cassette domain-containing protein [Pseudobutyrivibrio sp.]
MKIVLQTSQSDCLIACATMIMSSFGSNIPAYVLAEKIELSKAGSNVLQLREALREFGFGVDGYKVEKIETNDILPAIAYVNNNHFIVITKVKSKSIEGIDPAIGKIKYTIEEFNEIYSGVIIKMFQTEKKCLKNKTTLAIGRFKNSGLGKLLVGMMFAAVTTQIVAMSYSYIYQSLIDDSPNKKVFIILIAAIIVLCLGSLIQGILTNKFNIVFEKVFGNNLVDQIVAKNYKFFSFRSNGDLLYRINARGTIKDTLLLKLVPSIIALCTIILVQIMLFLKNSVIGFVFTIFSLMYIILYVLIGLSIYAASNKYTQKIIKLNTTSENIIRAVLTIKVLGVQKSFTEKWHNENEAQTKEYGILVLLQSLQNVISNIFLYIVPIATIVIGSIWKEQDFVKQMALLPLLYLVIQNITVIGQAFNSVYSTLPIIDKTKELIDEGYMQDRQRMYEENAENLISIRDLSYHYGSKQIFKDVNLNIKKGKRYAVIGRSGSGKSTFLKVVANLLCDYQGEVVFDKNVDGTPIYMDQDTTIIDGSIMENIIFGQKDISPERIDQMAKAIGLDTIIENQPLKWQTEIAKGKNLSRGQEQRVCLGRCLLKESDIYLLDEATSNIDVIDEEAIINNLLTSGGILDGKTVFISTHKLSLISYVDEIIFIDNGKVYTGTQEELLHNNQAYRELFQKNDLQINLTGEELTELVG